MKKAQAQTITYILAVFTGALILIFGFKTLISVTTNVDDLKLQEFKSKLSSDIQSSVAQFGSYSSMVYNVPRKLSEVCFSGQSDTPSSMNCSSLQDYPLARDSIEDNAGSNVFLIGTAPEPLYIPYVDTGVCKLRCFKAKNEKLSLVLEGKGNSTLIS